MYEATFSSFKSYYDCGSLVWKDFNGNLITLKPYIQFIIGDTLGNNELCGHYLANCPNCLTKDCKCKFGDLIKTNPPSCSPMTLTWQDLQLCKHSDGSFDHKKVFEKYSEKNLITLKDLSDV